MGAGGAGGVRISVLGAVQPSLTRTGASVHPLRMRLHSAVAAYGSEVSGLGLTQAHVPGGVERVRL